MVKGYYYGCMVDFDEGSASLVPRACTAYGAEMNIVEGGCRLYAESTTCRWYAVHLATPCDSQVYGGLPNVSCHKDKALNPTRLHHSQYGAARQYRGHGHYDFFYIFFFFGKAHRLTRMPTRQPPTHPSPTKPARNPAVGLMTVPFHLF